MGDYSGQMYDTRRWCSACYRRKHQSCSGLHLMKTGIRKGSRCECEVCYPVIRVR